MIDQDFKNAFAYIAELHERLKMNETPQITITDTNGQSAVYVPKAETKLPDRWLDALEFAKVAREELRLESSEVGQLLIRLIVG